MTTTSRQISARVFAQIPRVVEMLDALATARGFPLAAWLGVDATQVSRWRGWNPTGFPTRVVRDPKRPVPLACVASAAAQCGSQGNVLFRLHNIEELLVALTRRTLALDPTGDLLDTLLNRLQEILDAEPINDIALLAPLCLQYVHAAFQVVSDLASGAVVGFSEPVVHQFNVALGISYPSNLLVGGVLNSRWMCETANQGGSARARFLGALGRQVRKGQEAASRTDLLCALHAAHLLVRFGGPEERGTVQRHMSAGTLGGAPVARHMLSSAVLHAGGADQADADFAAQLQISADLFEASLAFDALHYGDTCFHEHAAASAPKRYARTLTHLARNATRQGPSRPSAAMAVKLAGILRRMDPTDPFFRNNPRVAEGLAGLLHTPSLERSIRDDLYDAARGNLLTFNLDTRTNL